MQTLQQAKQVFNAANLSIANRSLKCKKEVKELILWARRVRKQDIDFFSDQSVKIHFYSIKRRSLFHSKKLIEIQDEDEFANEQLNEETSTETEEVLTGQSHEEANTEKEEMFIKENHKENDDDACENDTDEETENILIIPSTDDFKMKFERSFDRMKTEEKWYLSNGRCVEDELFAFGMQCKVEHPCHSFIVDPTDSNYQKYGVFSEEELMEIRSFKEKKLPTMPTALRDYLNQYNLTTTAALRQKIFSVEPLDPEYSQDINWIKYSVYSFVREYDSGNLKRAHSEEWYKAHVWHFLDTIFDNEPEIEVLRGEKSSFSSCKRKNKERSIGAIDTRHAKIIGYKCDMIFRRIASNHDDILEFGATEAGKDYDGDQSTKRLTEGFIKLPKCLKDMLDNLALKTEFKNDIEVVGYLHSGLQSVLLRADRPTSYITRITRDRSVHISSNISEFGLTVLPSLYSAWLTREIVKRVSLLITSPTASTNNKETDSSWLENYWNPSNSLPIIIPETSTSSDTTHRKKKSKSKM